MALRISSSDNLISDLRRGKLLLTDIEAAKKNEIYRRRVMRLQQVRQQSKDIANTLRSKLQTDEKQKKENVDKDKLLRHWEQKKISQLQGNYQDCLKNVGKAHLQASNQCDPDEIISVTKVKNDLCAAIRGKLATDILHDQQHELSKVAEAGIIRKKHTRLKEDLRSNLVASLPPPLVKESLKRSVFTVNRDFRQRMNKRYLHLKKRKINGKVKKKPKVLQLIPSNLPSNVSSWRNIVNGCGDNEIVSDKNFNEMVYGLSNKTSSDQDQEQTSEGSGIDGDLLFSNRSQQIKTTSDSDTVKHFDGLCKQSCVDGIVQTSQYIVKCDCASRKKMSDGKNNHINCELNSDCCVSSENRTRDSNNGQQRRFGSVLAENHFQKNGYHFDAWPQSKSIRENENTSTDDQPVSSRVTEYYDYNNKFHSASNKSKPHITRLLSAQSNSENFEKEAKAVKDKVWKTQLLKDQQAKRNNKAMQKQQVQNEFKHLMKDLKTLDHTERQLRNSTAPFDHRRDMLRQDALAKNEKKIESLLCNDNFDVLPKNAIPSTGTFGSDKLKRIDHDPNSPTKNVKLNVAFQKSPKKESHTDKHKFNTSIKESNDTAKNRLSLQELMQRINHQREVLFSEMKDEDVIPKGKYTDTVFETDRSTRQEKVLHDKGISHESNRMPHDFLNEEIDCSKNDDLSLPSGNLAKKDKYSETGNSNKQRDTVSKNKAADIKEMIESLCNDKGKKDRVYDKQQSISMHEQQKPVSNGLLLNSANTSKCSSAAPHSTDVMGCRYSEDEKFVQLTSLNDKSPIECNKSNERTPNNKMFPSPIRNPHEKSKSDEIRNNKYDSAMFQHKSTSGGSNDKRNKDSSEESGTTVYSLDMAMSQVSVDSSQETSSSNFKGVRIVVKVSGQNSKQMNIKQRKQSKKRHKENCIKKSHSHTKPEESNSHKKDSSKCNGSSSTSYMSPPEHLTPEQVNMLQKLFSEIKNKDDNGVSILRQYIMRLLSMSRDSVNMLGVSSSDVSISSSLFENEKVIPEDSINIPSAVDDGKLHITREPNIRNSCSNNFKDTNFSDTNGKASEQQYNNCCNCIKCTYCNSNTESTNDIVAKYSELAKRYAERISNLAEIIGDLETSTSIKNSLINCSRNDTKEDDTSYLNLPPETNIDIPINSERNQPGLVHSSFDYLAHEISWHNKLISNPSIDATKISPNLDLSGLIGVSTTISPAPPYHSSPVEQHDYHDENLISPIPVRPKPPPSLLNGKMRIGTPHELSTIQEVDTPSTSRPHLLYQFSNKKQQQCQSDVKDSVDCEQLSDEKIQDINLSFLTLKSQDEESVSDHDDQLSVSSDTFPDIMSELLRHGILTSPFFWAKEKINNENQTDGTIPNIPLDSSSSSSSCSNNINESGAKRCSFMDNPSSSQMADEEVRGILKESSPEDFEAALDNLGLGWASATLRKTKRASQANDNDTSSCSEYTRRSPYRSKATKGINTPSSLKHSSNHAVDLNEPGTATSSRNNRYRLTPPDVSLQSHFVTLSDETIGSLS